MVFIDSDEFLIFRDGPPVQSLPNMLKEYEGYSGWYLYWEGGLSFCGCGCCRGCGNCTMWQPPDASHSMLQRCISKARRLGRSVNAM